MELTTVAMKKALAKREKGNNRSLMWSINIDMRDLVGWIQIDFKLNGNDAKRAALKLVKHFISQDVWEKKSKASHRTR